MAGGKRVPAALVKSLAALFLAVGITAGGGYTAYRVDQERAQNQEYIEAAARDPGTSTAVKIAMVMGNYYESSNRHIGRPYIDKVGRGKPWTVCNGLTPAVVKIDPGHYYTPAECYALERAVYVKTEAQAIGYTSTWAEITDFQRASIIDFLHNKGAGNYATSTMRRKFEAGDAVGGCRENPRWTKSAGAVLTGLVTRAGSNAEICETWKVQP